MFISIFLIREYVRNMTYCDGEQPKATNAKFPSGHWRVMMVASSPEGTGPVLVVVVFMMGTEI